MKDEDKTREELIKELAIMRQQVTELREREMADNHAKTVEIYRKKLGKANTKYRSLSGLPGAVPVS